MHLTLDYRSDWRVQAALFRIGGGSAQLAKQALEVRLRQLVWAALWATIAALALHWRTWVIVIPAALVSFFLLTYSLALRNLGKKAAFGLRALWRKSEARRIRLDVSDDGIREFDGDVSSFAPWQSVKSYWLFRGVICLNLSSGQAALIPVATLVGGPYQVELLMQELKARGIPCTDVGGAR
ncbi:MAG: YcxB family protein [Rhodospirillaceae bacterium]